jgi:hypothetical protein
MREAPWDAMASMAGFEIPVRGGSTTIVDARGMCVPARYSSTGATTGSTAARNASALPSRSAPAERSPSTAVTPMRPSPASATAKRPTPAYKSTISPSRGTASSTVVTSRGSRKRLAWKNDAGRRRNSPSVTRPPVSIAQGDRRPMDAGRQVAAPLDLHEDPALVSRDVLADLCGNRPAARRPPPRSRTRRQPASPAGAGVWAPHRRDRACLRGRSRRDRPARAGAPASGSLPAGRAPPHASSGILPRRPNASAITVRLQGHLPVVGDVREQAAATSDVEARVDAIGRRLEHVFRKREGHPLVHPLDPGPHPLAGNGSEHEDDPSLVPSDHPPAAAGFSIEQVDCLPWRQ